MSSKTSAMTNEKSSISAKSVLGIAISDLSRPAAMEMLATLLDDRIHTKLAFCNAHTANLAWENAEFRKTLASFTVLADGIGVDIAASFTYGRSFAANLNGTDFVPAFLRSQISPRRIAIVGGQPGIVEKAVDALIKTAPQHDYHPLMHGFSSDAEVVHFLETLKAEPVDILLVAMGNPIQEEWIANHVTSEHATLAIGVGALLDFLAGRVVRAPLFMQKMRLEWLFRLIQEPKRLFARYVLGNPLFLMRVMMIKLGVKQF